MTFGAAATPQDVPAYLSHVRGSPPTSELVAEFQRRYRLAGGSPLVRNTWAQALALESLLNTQHPNAFHVRVGMRHTPPFIHEGLQQLLAKDATQIIGLILSPQYSPYIMGGYHRALDEARDALSCDITVRVAGAWHTLPAFIDALASRVSQAIESCPTSERHTLPVLMTAHSLPKPVADSEPEYLQQLRDTADAVAQRASLSPDQWQFAYQSAGHTPQEWLRPDIKELFPALRQAGHRRALVVPVQFLSDHLEVLYDIDVAACQEAEASGIDLIRIQTPGLMPQMIETFAQVVHRELQQMPQL